MNIQPEAVLAVPGLVLSTIAVLALLATALRRVPEGVAVTIQRFGRYRRTLGPGWHLTIPLLDRVGKRVTLLGHHLEIHAARAPAADADVYYQILEPCRTGQAIDDVDALVGREVRERLEALCAEPGAADLPELGARLKVELNRQFERLGLMVIRCQLHVSTGAISGVRTAAP